MKNWPVLAILELFLQEIVISVEIDLLHRLFNIFLNCEINIIYRLGIIPAHSVYLKASIFNFFTQHR